MHCNFIHFTKNLFYWYKWQMWESTGFSGFKEIIPTSIYFDRTVPPICLPLLPPYSRWGWVPGPVVWAPHSVSSHSPPPQVCPEPSCFLSLFHLQNRSPSHLFFCPDCHRNRPMCLPNFSLLLLWNPASIHLAICKTQTRRCLWRGSQSVSSSLCCPSHCPRFLPPLFWCTALQSPLTFFIVPNVMVNCMCQLGWATVPTQSVKYYFGCF